MARSVRRDSRRRRITIEVSPQSYDLLHQLLESGLYGLELGEVAARFVDAGLIREIKREVVPLEIPRDC